MNIRHSVLIVTYNQENLLPRALDSVLNQTVLPYEIIIGDDCSTDKTWEVALKYQKKYPSIVKPYRNETNLGVFGNFNKMIKQPVGDIVSFVSGDDYYEQGIFEEYNRMIEENNIDVLNDKFILLANSIAETPDGKRFIKDNTQFKGKDLFKVKIRYGLDFRETGFSINVVKQLSPIPLNLGYNADWLFAIDQIVKAEDFYYTNKAFPVYCIGIGVATKTKATLMKKSLVAVIEEIERLYHSKLDNYDRLYLSFLKRITNFEIGESSSISALLKDYFKVREDVYLSEYDLRVLRNRLILIILRKIHLYKPAHLLLSIVRKTK